MASSLWTVYANWACLLEAVADLELKSRFQVGRQGRGPHDRTLFHCLWCCPVCDGAGPEHVSFPVVWRVDNDVEL